MFQILSLPSQPTEAEKGSYLFEAYPALIFGEYLIVETQSLWLFLSVVCLHSPTVFHNLIVLSAPLDMIYLLSAEKSTENTSAV